MNDGAVTSDPVRSFTLDLLYPAVLGAMIVLLFMRIANFGLAPMTEPTTQFGIFIASFYSIGFVNAKMIAHYNVALAVLDVISSVLIFICLYMLGFSHDQMPSGVNYVWFYILLSAVTFSPILRRIFRGERTIWSLRTWLGFGSTLIALLAVLNAIGIKHLSWLTPDHVLELLSVIFVIYLGHLWWRGVVA